MKPQVQPIGNLFDLVAGGLCIPRQTYKVGEWVWAKRAGRTTRRYLACIEPGQPIEAAGELAWLVRIYRSGRGWMPPEHRRIAGRLNEAEIEQHRKSGQIPPAGQLL